jgi:hypothetical protein
MTLTVIVFFTTVYYSTNLQKYTMIPSDKMLKHFLQMTIFTSTVTWQTTSHRNSTFWLLRICRMSFIISTSGTRTGCGGAWDLVRIICVCELCPWPSISISVLDLAARRAHRDLEPGDASSLPEGARIERTRVQCANRPKKKGTKNPKPRSQMEINWRKQCERAATAERASFAAVVAT